MGISIIYSNRMVYVMKSKIIKVVLLSFAMQLYSQGKYSDRFVFAKPGSKRQTFIQQYKNSQGDDVDQMSQEDLRAQLAKNEIQGTCTEKNADSNYQLAGEQRGLIGQDQNGLQGDNLLTECRLLLTKFIQYIFGLK